MIYAMAPLLPGFHIESIETVDNEYIIVARATSPTATCPDCGQVSSQIHSWYERNPRDLPSCGSAVRLSLQVRKFFCRSLSCTRRVFCERLPQLIQRYARHTKRLATSLTILAFALGGKEGERIVAKIGMPVSRDTLLRLMRKEPDAPLPAPRVVGVDDWAFRKGHTYGTLLCDLERGGVIDLLPDREAETVAKWLKAHPTVEIVTRDRSQAYAAGVREGAPDAIQIADRWHLANNLIDALEATLAQHPNRLQGAPVQEKLKTVSGGEPLKSDKQSTVKEDMLAAREAKRALRLAKYEQVIALYGRGVRQVDIASQVGISSKTVNRWLAHGSFPERKPRASQPTKVDVYRTYVQKRWQEGCHNVAQIYREIWQKGYAGSYTTLYEHCRDLQPMQDGELASSCPDALQPPKRRYSPRQAAFLFIRQPGDLSERQQADLEVMLVENPQFNQWRTLGQQFMSLLRERDVDAFDTWLTAVAKYGSGSMKRFASGLRSDYAEVAAALTYEWSNGSTEGHINKLKLIKRQMFGRAKLDLLRKRIMHRN